VKISTTFIALMLIVCLTAFLMPPNPYAPEIVHADSVNLSPQADSYVYQGLSGSNYGTSTSLWTNPRASYARRTWVRFDLSSIPGGATITSAKLKLYYYSYDGTNPSGRTIECHHCTDDSWTETGITWGNAPNTQCAGSATDSETVPASYGWMEWVVTSDVQSDFSGDKKSSWRLKDSSEVGNTACNVIWASKEHATATWRPILEVTYTTADFSISASPNTLTMSKGSSGTSTITVTSTVGGFNSPVTLTASDLPSGVTASFVPNPVTPPAGGSVTSTLTLNVGATATEGTYTINVVGTAGSISHSTPITLTIFSGPDFGIIAWPDRLYSPPGENVLSEILVYSIAGFSEEVTLSASGLPAGAVALFEDASLVPPSSGEYASTQLTISTDPAIEPGIYEFTVTGTGGGKVHSANVCLVILDITYGLVETARAGTTKIIVTCRWSEYGQTRVWIELLNVSSQELFGERSMNVYERQTTDVGEEITTWNYFKRVELIFAEPVGHDQIWVVLVYTGELSSYQIDVEIY